MVDFEVDTDALRAFQKAISDPQVGLLATMDSDPGLQSSLDMVDPKRGKSSLNLTGSLRYAQFGSAYELAGRYGKQVDLWTGNYQSLRGALALLAEVAGRLADSYDSANDSDALSAKAIDDAFNTAPVPQLPQSTGQTSTTGTTTHMS